MAVRDIKLQPNSAVAKRVLPIALDGVIATSQTDRRILIHKPGFPFFLLPAEVYARVVAANIAFNVTVANGDGVVGAVDATLAIHSTPDQFACGAFNYVIGGIGYSKGAATGLEFSQAFTIANNTFGASLIQVNAAGTISTKEPSAAMSYATAGLAVGNLPAPDAGNVAIGYILIAPTAGTFTANTTALTTIATFVDEAPITRAISALVPVAGSPVQSGTPTFAAGFGDKDAVIVVQYTTDGSGDVTDGFLQLAYRPYPLNGEATRAVGA